MREKGEDELNPWDMGGMGCDIWKKGGALRSPIEVSQSMDVCCHCAWNSRHDSSSGGIKNSISICSNSLDRKMKLRGVICFGN